MRDPSEKVSTKPRPIQSVDEVRPIRDEISKPVAALVDELFTTIN